MRIVCSHWLPHGVVVKKLTSHRDERGVLSEIYRNEWEICAPPIQWNAVRSQAGVLRGVHVHPTHADYLVVLNGRMILGLSDIRRSSPSPRASTLIELGGEEFNAIYVPTGVAHGFYFVEPTTYVYAVSHYWDLSDELGCRWNDSALGLDWPVMDPVLSQRDATAGSYAAMVAAFEHATAKGATSP